MAEPIPEFYQLNHHFLATGGDVLADVSYATHAFQNPHVSGYGPLTNFVGEGYTLLITECIMEAIVDKHGPAAVFPGCKMLRCVHGIYPAPPNECLMSALGLNNPRKICLATIANLHLLDEVRGLPMLTVVEENLTYRGPSQFQLDYVGRNDAAQVVRDWEAEDGHMKRKLDNLRQRAKKKGFR